jgi:hypothetical protein
MKMMISMQETLKKKPRTPMKKMFTINIEEGRTKM